ncbi:MAG: bifunctional phosphopantothenoylcysteine decarboxylase/phosphopantothenate--cysteine ligase CoaBC [Calditrichaeota bacterium]|nr:bifunctional phosphopantothenoylcysteine decarboxylase/phosphopantothenate--cysteine ligase CoaBC [Calditrichota bacterium]
MFFDKKVLVGVTGGIAAYKAALLIRELKKESAQVRVVMTDAATKFVAPLTFETLSENPVLLDLFPVEGGLRTAHIDWARWPDIIIICPATANTIGKIAAGIADNALTTTIMATTEAVVFCPAMNKEMYAHPIFQENVAKLEKNGYTFVAPGKGALACGEEGWGRLAEIDDILFAAKKILSPRHDLKNKRVLVTAGPTEEPLDPVRFITNRSSGKMGFALAEAASLRGAEVTLVSGPTNLVASPGIKLVKVRTANEMSEAVFANLGENDVLLMAAAVSDFRPKKISKQKLKKADAKEILELERTADILAEAASRKGTRIHVGFSVETENEIKNSRLKLQNKGLDFIVLNNPLQEGAGFAVDTNRVTILDASGAIEKLPLMSKAQVSDKILDRVGSLLQKRDV